MMMALGMFVFSLPTVAYQSLRRSTDWRHASNSRMGTAPGYQFVGRGEDSTTLSGLLIPELAGSAGALALLRRMADTGKAYILVDGSGTVYGPHIIDKIDEDHSEFFFNGQSQRVDFSISLKSVGDDQARTLLDDLKLPIGRMDSSILDWSL
ncbi:oxidoreductase [Bordetella trematum]|uniref:Phage protein U n=1 Tax=Bordetella trematum TaxID=123899 RepID=A0A157SK12_9BORD|nr:phage tail protein [Bordetella trematum]AZR93241.1 oxidoreductase [Bordetella trematum]NNH20891.1 phage tail protein [Bordetella trematum]SAI22863.1 Phage protein U [Bordetella trematum]SAI70601.1 Phage protein U [Bordetella trematum]SUV98736.1 Phage protein U [Bordetella trematum]